LPRTHLLGIDVGTSLVRAVVYDLEGREVGRASRKSETESPHPGWAQQDMAAVWRLTAEAIREAVAASAVAPSDLAAVGPSGQGDGAWLLDVHGQPVCKAPLWNDGRAADVVESWQSRGLLARAFVKGGTMLWPGALAPLLAFLREHEPELHGRIATAFCCKDWITYRLTGVLGTDESDGSIPFMSLATRSYDPGQAEMLGLGDDLAHLPQVRRSHEVVGEVSGQAAAATGLCAGTPVVAGMLDVAANAVGVGALAPGQTLTILGTTALNAVVLGAPVFDPGGIGATLCHAVPGRWLRVLGAMAGTPNLEWYVAAMGEIFRAEAARRPEGLWTLVEEAVAASPAGAGGVLYHPYLQGERAPFMNPNARAGFFGIGAGTTRADLARAVHEGVGLAIRDCLEAVGRRRAEVMLAGGGSRSQAWCQILADVTGRPMCVPAGSEFGTLGAAAAAGVGTGLFTDYEDAVKRCVRIERVYEPRPRYEARYAELYLLYRELQGALSSFWERRERLVRRWTEEG